VIVGSGAGSVTVGSGIGRLGSPLGGGVVGAAVGDSGASVLLGAGVGAPLAEEEPPESLDLRAPGVALAAVR
jgi:hypothetical protein